MLGDLVLDIVAAAPTPVAEGSDVPGTIRFRAGGSAANSARVFASLGGRATFVGAVGDDALGRRLAAALRSDQVTARLAVVGAPTARLVALVDGSGQRSFVTQRGAADGLSATDLREEWFAAARAVHIPAYSLLAEPVAAAALRAVELTRRRGGLVSVDLASRGPLLAKGRRAARERIVAVAPDLLFANASEAVGLAGSSAVASLVDLAPVVVIKEGVRGCRVLWRGEAGVLQLAVATTPVTTGDTTGAGDAFDAGFLFTVVSARPSDGASDGEHAWLRQAAVLRRAAVGGHRAAARLLARPRAELVL